MPLCSAADLGGDLEARSPPVDLQSLISRRKALERFLTSQGRRRYLKPLYTKLAATNLAMAKRIYTKARPTYHPLAQATIDAILKWQ